MSKYFLCLLLLQPFLDLIGSLSVNKNPYLHSKDFSPTYHVTWFADYSDRRVTFNITVRTKGWVGFGLSKKGLMQNGDIMIGGVFPDGNIYLTDMHAKGHELPLSDCSQDWELIQAQENETHTFLSVVRDFDTCDEDDIPLLEHGDITSMIWAYGETDTDVSYHFNNRGSYETYIVDGDLMPTEIEGAHPFGNYVDGSITNVDDDWRVWTILKAERMPAEETTYLCTFLKVPEHNETQHIVGFRHVMESELEFRHIHHYILYRCLPPPNMSAMDFFGPFINKSREACYNFNAPLSQSRVPFQYCSNVVHGHGVGAEYVFYPEHVGQTMSGDVYMLQMHYNNPEKRADVDIKFALEVFYTNKIREHEIGVIMLGTAHPGSPSIMIPPSSIDHTIYGHCHSGCTNLMFPKGVNITHTLLHTHLAGTGVRMYHIRNGKHLPWISYDDNFNFNNQKIRMLNQERTVLPGDTLAMRCLYTTTNRNDNMTIGGYSSRAEMCNLMFWYYPAIQSDAHSICVSVIESESYRNLIGIQNSTWSEVAKESIVTSPLGNSGLLESEAGTKIQWTKQKRKTLQEIQRKIPQVSICPSSYITDPSRIGVVDEDHQFLSESLENFPQYEPPRLCKEVASSAEYMPENRS